MDHFPQTFDQFNVCFSTERSCRNLLFNLRWPSGFVCPTCNNKEEWQTRSGRIICRRCRFTTTVTAGTIFQDSHQPLTVWFRMMWLMTSEKKRPSALEFKKLLHLGSYRTAWMMSQKLRAAVLRQRLAGTVRLGHLLMNWDDVEDKKVFVIAVEEDDKKAIGRIRMSRLIDDSAASIHDFIERTIEPGSTILAPDRAVYQELLEKGYRYVGIPSKRTFNQRRANPLHALNEAYRLFISFRDKSDHLSKTMDEFIFYFNGRTSFLKLVQHAVGMTPVPYTALVKGVRGRVSRKQKHLKPTEIPREVSTDIMTPSRSCN